MSLGLEEGLLKDLARWDFGAILAKRAGLQGLEPKLLTLEVRAYRLAILRRQLPSPLFGDRAFVLEAAFEGFDPDESWLCCQAWLGREASPGYFVERLSAKLALGEAEAPLQRFALGKAHKYGLRVAYLLKKFEGARLEN